MRVMFSELFACRLHLVISCRQQRYVMFAQELSVPEHAACAPRRPAMSAVSCMKHCYDCCAASCHWLHIKLHSSYWCAFVPQMSREAAK